MNGSFLVLVPLGAASKQGVSFQKDRAREGPEREASCPILYSSGDTGKEDREAAIQAPVSFRSLAQGRLVAFSGHSPGSLGYWAELPCVVWCQLLF